MIRKQRRIGFPAFLYVFSVLMVALGAAFVFLLPIGYDSTVKQYAAKSWPVTQGTVVHSSVREGEGDGEDAGPTYNAKVSVEYNVNGQSYRINEIYFSQANAWTSNRSHATRASRTYQQGRQVDVYFDPARPASATLEPGLKPWNVVIVSLGVLFGLFGLLVFWFAVRNTYRFVRFYFDDGIES